MKERRILNRKRVTIAVLVAAALAAAAVAFYRFGGAEFDWNLFFSTLSEIDPAWLAASVLLVLSTYLGRALRWRVMIRPIKPGASLWNLLSATIIGFTAVVVLGRPGELVRPYLIAAKEGVTFSSQAAAWLLERIYDLLMVLLLFGLALTRPRQEVHIGTNIELMLRTGGFLAAVLALVSVGILVFAGLFSEAAKKRLAQALPAIPENYRSRIEQVLASFLGGMSSTASRFFVLQLVAYTVLEWTLIMGGMYCLLRSYPPTAHLTLADTLVFAGFVAFGSAVQIPGIGGGMQVVAILVLTELFGLGLEAATALALFLWLVTWIVITPFGVILGAVEGLNWRSLRQIRTRAEKLQESELKTAE